MFFLFFFIFRELNKHNEKHIKEYQEELNHSFIANQDSTTILMENIHIDKDMDMKHSVSLSPFLPLIE